MMLKGLQSVLEKEPFVDVDPKSVKVDSKKYDCKQVGNKINC